MHFVLIVRLVSDNQLNRFRQFAKSGKIIITGDSCLYDEFFLIRKPGALDDFFASKNVSHLKDMPERISPGSVKYHGTNYNFIPVPPKGDEFIQKLLEVYTPQVKVIASPFVAIDTFRNDKDENFFLKIMSGLSDTYDKIKKFYKQ